MSHAFYRVIGYGNPLRQGVAGSRYAFLQGVAKANSPSAPYCLPNEMICAEIGRFLGLPVPPFALVSGPSSAPFFVSLDFNLTGDSLPPIDPVLCVRRLPGPSTGLLLFDTLVGNCDRHTCNLAADLLVSPPRLSVFDHSHALFGYVPGEGISRLQGLRDRLGMSGGLVTGPNRHCLLDVLDTTDHFQEWITRAKAIPDFMLWRVCREAVGLGISEEEASAAVDFLAYRREHLADIVMDNWEQFASIQQGTMLT